MLTADSSPSPALEFHRLTNHSPESVRAAARPLDWANEPYPFKRYRGLETVLLPVIPPESTQPALTAIAGASAPRAGRRALSFAELAAILRFSAGITRWLNTPSGPRAFRAAACTGALYHVELYVVAGDLEGLGAGVYHYDPEHDTLEQLRSGDWRGALEEATARQQWVATAPATEVLTTTYWRNA